jgi:hypothetical protein
MQRNPRKTTMPDQQRPALTSLPDYDHADVGQVLKSTANLRIGSQTRSLRLPADLMRSLLHIPG